MVGFLRWEGSDLRYQQSPTIIRRDLIKGAYLPKFHSKHIVLVGFFHQFVAKKLSANCSDGTLTEDVSPLLRMRTVHQNIFQRQVGQRSLLCVDPLEVGKASRHRIFGK